MQMNNQRKSLTSRQNWDRQTRRSTWADRVRTDGVAGTLSAKLLGVELVLRRLPLILEESETILSVFNEARRTVTLDCTSLSCLRDWTRSDFMLLEVLEVILLPEARLTSSFLLISLQTDGFGFWDRLTTSLLILQSNFVLFAAEETFPWLRS